MYYPSRPDFSETAALQENLGKIIIFWSISPIGQQFHMQAGANIIISLALFPCRTAVIKRQDSLLALEYR